MNFIIKELLCKNIAKRLLFFKIFQPNIQRFMNKFFILGRGLSKFKKNYQLTEELGRGGFGIVYGAIRTNDETPVAVKFIDRRYVREWGKVI